MVALKFINMLDMFGMTLKKCIIWTYNKQQARGQLAIRTPGGKMWFLSSL